ncbi:FAD:protein FMN transferase [Nonomuraea turcica]|uniref:FAD:protein FMN transferase n=1 Tax=Nonomuraea sp. G32 TaxID=3067274 RepID=UPI00273B54E9|nr:FAD:protein FMN transferase [Nonomuraea sp. G32]MDP4501833.1 FAD:protein FMN transferase [Nonomuraea sp. G32]
MDTLVTIQLAVPASEAPAWAGTVARAFRWFAAVEATCSRFDPASEVSRLIHQAGRPVPVSSMLFEALSLGLVLAEATDGAFDPTIGHRQETAGYDRNYRTGERWRSGIHPGARPTYRDVLLDPAGRTVTLRRPVLFDLGGLAKGLAVDLATRELADAPGAVVDAGGDVYARGADRDGRPWRIGIADPRRPGTLLGSLRVTDGAVAGSGGTARGAHILDPRPASVRGERPVGVTVSAPTTVIADALSTAAFVLGVTAGRDLLDNTDEVEGLMITRSGERITTSGFALDTPEVSTS